MPLTQRQYWMLRAFYKNEGQFIKTSYFANALHCTARSIQNDLATLRHITRQEPSFLLENRKANGTRIIIFDSDGFQHYLDTNSDPSIERMNNKDYRIMELFRILLRTRERIALKELSTIAFSSTSTIRSDLKELSSLLSRFDLSLSVERGYAILDGKESARRQAIFFLAMDQEMAHSAIPGLRESSTLFSTILTTAAKKEGMAISDYYRNRAIFLLQIVLKRIAEGFYLEENCFNDQPTVPSLNISTALFNAARDAWHITIKQQELIYYAFLLQPALMTNDPPALTSTIPWVHASLEKISALFPVVLSEDVILIHHLNACIPDLTHYIQAKIKEPHDLDEFVASQNPMAMDMAILFAHHMHQNTGLKPSPHAICQLSLFFQDSLLRHGLVRYRIGLITALPDAEKILLKELLRKEFGSHIDTIDLLNSPKAGYDRLLTTEEEIANNSPNISYLIYPPDHRQLENIYSMITGYSPDHVLRLFSSKLFFTADIDDRTAVETYLIQQTSRITSNSLLSSSIQERNALFSSYYENGVAILKPIMPMPAKSFASILLLKNGISWEPGHTVSLLILLSVSQKDPETMMACNDLIPSLFEAGWRQSLNGSDHFPDLINLFRVRLSRCLFESGMPNLKPDPRFPGN